MSWDSEYERNERIWGEGPGELAIAAVEYLRERKSNELLKILDIGCGYGRDAFYFSDNLRCKVVGIDVSEKAIDIASNTVLEAQKEDVTFQCCNFTELKRAKYHVVFASNLYQLLRANERKQLRRTVMRTLRPKGWLFLSTLSVRDPQHGGKGVPVPKESNSVGDSPYLHLCTKEELLQDFPFLDIKELYEHEYYEPRVTGEVHHHVSWILIAQHAG